MVGERPSPAVPIDKCSIYQVQDGSQDLVHGDSLFRTETNHLHGIGDSLEADFVAAQGLEGTGEIGEG